ncbi:MAG: hypothetical protein KDB14_30325 [Planctomycetales bacterium]|nr:hypothetical protein [Planctomycetales bacterium]
MRIDVTDLFDDLFAVATIAYTRFRFVPADGNGAKLDEWDAFCAHLSDAYFLNLVANRAHELIRQDIPILDIKRRIIVRHEMGVDGQRGFNLPYEFPVFHHSSNRPCAFAGTLTVDGHSQIYPFLFRPKHSLTLHLGKIPASEFQIDRPPYDPSSDSQKLYYCEHGYETMFSGTVSKFYELHDGWILREITLGDRLSRHAMETPWWKPVDNLVSVNAGLFENLWRVAEDGDAK